MQMLARWGCVLPGIAMVLLWGMDCLRSLLIMIQGVVKFKAISPKDRSDNVAWG